MIDLIRGENTLEQPMLDLIVKSKLKDFADLALNEQYLRVCKSQPGMIDVTVTLKNKTFSYGPFSDLEAAKKIRRTDMMPAMFRYKIKDYCQQILNRPPCLIRKRVLPSGNISYKVTAFRKHAIGTFEEMLEYKTEQIRAGRVPELLRNFYKGLRRVDPEFEFDMKAWIIKCCEDIK